MHFRPMSLGVLAVTLATAAVASAGPPVHLKRSAASYATQEALNRRFHEGYEYRAGGAVNCKRKISLNVRRCKVSWVIGDASYIGVTTVALYERTNHSKLAIVRYRIHGIDEYCVFVRHEPVARCDHHFHGRARVGL